MTSAAASAGSRWRRSINIHFPRRSGWSKGVTVAVTSQHELSRNVRTTKMHELKCARVRSRGASSAAVAATNEAVAEEAVDAVDDGEVGDGEINESGLVPRVE